jgi:hypothetical protein
MYYGTISGRFKSSLGRWFRVWGPPREPVALVGLACEISLGRHLLTGSYRLLTRDDYLFPSCYGSLLRFGYGFDARWRLQLQPFRGAMVAVMQRLDARGFFFNALLGVSAFLALFLQVLRNRFRCHPQSLPELSPANCAILATLSACRSSDLTDFHAYGIELPARSLLEVSFCLVAFVDNDEFRSYGHEGDKDGFILAGRDLDDAARERIAVEQPLTQSQMAKPSRSGFRETLSRNP